MIDKVKFYKSMTFSGIIWNMRKNEIKKIQKQIQESFFLAAVKRFFHFHREGMVLTEKWKFFLENVNEFFIFWRFARVHGSI